MSTRMNADAFEALAEQAHTRAENIMRSTGMLASQVLLYDFFAEPVRVALRGDFEDQIPELRRIVRSLKAVAAIRLGLARGLLVPARLAEQPEQDIPAPCEASDSRLLILSEARWPNRQLYQIRTTGMWHDEDGLQLIRDINGPDQRVVREDSLLKLFS